MADQIYASLAINSFFDKRVMLPISPLASKRLSFRLARNSADAAATEVGVITPWLQWEPALLLWCNEASDLPQPSLDAWQSWLDSDDGIRSLAQHVRECSFNVEDLFDRVEAMYANLDGLQMGGESGLKSLLDRIREVYASSSGAATLVGSGRGEGLLKSEIGAVWRGDPAWGTLLSDLCQREVAFAERLQREKLLSMKQLAYGASHEINNPLANIATRAQTLLSDELDPRRRRTLATINQQAFRAHEMIADMMLFAMPPRMELADVPLKPLLDEVLAGIAELAAENGVRIKLDAPQDVNARVDRTQLAVALRCVSLNGVEAMPTGGEITISLIDHVASTAGERSGRPGVSITVHDNGPGMSDHVRRHLFDPFFSGREAGRGLGFGLSKAWRIITELGGNISFESPETGGSKFAIWLPQKGDRNGVQGTGGCDESTAPLV